MSRKRFVAAVLAGGILGVVSPGYAQGPPPPSGREMFPKPAQPKSLTEQFDDFTRRLLGLPPSDEVQGKRPVRQGAKAPTAQRVTHGPSSARAGSIFTLPSKPTERTDPSDSKSAAADARQPASAGSRPGPPAARLAGSPRAEAPRERSLGGPAGSTLPGTIRTGGSPFGARATTENLSGPADSTMLPLHERLSSFRESAFDRSRPTRPSPDSAPAADSAMVPRPGDSGPRTPTVARRTNPAIPPERPLQVGPFARPLVAQRTTPAVPPSDASPAVAGEPGLLFARKGPVLSVETTGSRQIAVGKESAYQVTIQNRGEVAAEDVVVFVTLPPWAEVASAQVSTGTTQAAAADRAAQPFQWRVGNLPSQGRERLVLKIVPRESRPFDLAVRWDYQPVASQAMIEVQEPKLVIGLDGPKEVLYGEKQVYTLKLSNTGNGDAENVLIELVPIGAGENQPVSHNLGRIEAGGRKTIEVELTARQVGDLTIKVQVRGDGGLHAELAEKVLVRRAALQVNVEGPKIQYVGGVAAYRISVRNPGTAPARKLSFSVGLPPGAKYLSGVEGARLETEGNKLAWDLETLDPAAERVFLVNCRLDSPGSTQINVVSNADGDLTASAGMTTRVEALADLALEVKDPTGPVPVGEEATYQVRIRNRGTKNAPDVQVMTYFSRGIEPTAAEGAQYKIQPGQLVFSPIASLAPGADLVLKVRARAETAGNHVFRAEVHCRPLDIRLVSEDTTHFYQDDSILQQASGSSPAGRLASPPADSPSNAVRREPAAPPATAGRPTPAPPRR